MKHVGFGDPWRVAPHNSVLLHIIPCATIQYTLTELLIMINVETQVFTWRDSKCSC